MKKIPTLKQHYADMILADTELMGRIAKEMGGRSWRTIERWCKNNHRNLTYPTVLKIMSEKTGVAVAELMESGDQ